MNEGLEDELYEQSPPLLESMLPTPPVEEPTEMGPYPFRIRVVFEDGNSCDFDVIELAIDVWDSDAVLLSTETGLKLRAR